MSNKNKKHYHNQNQNQSHNQNHKQHKEFDKKSFNKTNDKNNLDKQEKNNKHTIEINKMNEEIKALSAKISHLEDQNFKYKTEIAKINADYIKKIMEKSAEAQELVKAKQQELDAKFKAELDSQIANYIEKKFGPFLDSINQLSRIINSSNNSSNEVKNYLIGFKMILDLFYRALADLNISIIDIKVGDQFDENYMSAFEAVHVDNMKPNTVVEVISPAYKFMDKVIKHGLVKVQK